MSSEPDKQCYSFLRLGYFVMKEIRRTPLVTNYGTETHCVIATLAQMNRALLLVVEVAGLSPVGSTNIINY